jgi:hypothetical protein
MEPGEQISTVKDSLELYAVWELVDLLDAIYDELRAREVEVEQYSAMGEQGLTAWTEYSED